MVQSQNVTLTACEGYSFEVASSGTKGELYNVFKVMFKITSGSRQGLTVSTGINIKKEDSA